MVSSSPFEILGLPLRFALSKGELEAAHRELAKTLHPDRHRSRPAGERRLLLERAMKVNEAFRVLRDPVARAFALLAASGIEHDREREASPPGEFLMSVMEERETLSEAAAAKDRAQVEALIRSVGERRRATEGELGAKLDAGVRDLDDVLPLVGKLRYDVRFLEEAESLAEELGA